jgi:hypothetical protein
MPQNSHVDPSPKTTVPDESNASAPDVARRSRQEETRPRTDFDDLDESHIIRGYN